MLYNIHIIRKINKGVHMKVAAEMIPEESVGFKELRGDIMCKGPVAGGSMGRSSNWQKLRWFRCKQ